MAYLNFVEALMQAKRRAQLQGRPISEQETSGITEGFAKSAAETNLQEQGLETQKSQFAQTLAFEKEKDAEQRRIAEEERKHQKMRSIASGVGAVAGGILGTVYATPGYGTLAGAYVGSQAGAAMYEIDPLKGVANSIFGGCLIISSCTSPDSHEVQISREYRDTYMNERDLTGYYVISHYLVPKIRRFAWFKRFVKKVLVDRLVDHGGYILGYKRQRKYLTSAKTAHCFLGLCNFLGAMTERILEVKNA